MTRQRLTEHDVHAACADIVAQGERPTSLALLNHLGRGSLTTITKYLNSWYETDAAKALDAENLPSEVPLPSTLSQAGEALLKKCWHEARILANAELEHQHDQLKQAEAENQAKTEEAVKFSEVQAVKIEQLEEAVAALEAQLNGKIAALEKVMAEKNGLEKSLIGLTKDNEQLQEAATTLQAELKSARKQASDAEKKVARLEGQLEILMTQNPPQS